MWETAFEESMLNTHKDLIIHCPSKDLSEDLMEVLERNGVVWCTDEAPTMDTKWNANAEYTCYWVESKKLYYSDKQYADEDPDGEYAGHIRCTFHGMESPGFCTASDAELRSLLGI